MYKLDTTLCLKRKSEHKKGLLSGYLCLEHPAGWIQAHYKSYYYYLLLSIQPIQFTLFIYLVIADKNVMK